MSRKTSRRRKLTPGRVLRLTRIAVSVAMLWMVTMLLVSLEASVALALDWTAHIQLMPLIMAGSVTGVSLIIVVTLLFGRVYCSSVCPLGTTQDVIARLPRLSKKWRKKHPYRFSAPMNKFRYSLLVVIVGAALIGAAALPTLFDPYSSYARICVNLLRPVWEWLNEVPVMAASTIGIVVAVGTLLIVAGMAGAKGRLLCNTLCPIGSILSLFSRFSLFHFDIDTDVCVNCHKCSRACKAGCIDVYDHVVDGSRCVVCFDCVDVCSEQAIRYTLRRKKLSLPMLQKIGSGAVSAIITPEKEEAETTPITGDSPQGKKMKLDRRKFLAMGVVAAAAPAFEAVAAPLRRIAATDRESQPLRVSYPVVPPGRRTLSDFLDRCTGCGLCVAQCPAKVLRPSTRQLGWFHLLHPVMDYTRSYCRYNCTRCTQVCPTGALLPLTVDEKHIFIIGQARVKASNCIGCGLCAERCPREAVQMMPRPANTPGPSTRLAVVDPALCIGCGACEYICPASPQKAIGVDGFS